MIPHLVTVHCMAHRLQLVSEKAANSVPDIVNYIAVLNQFAKSLKFSPKFGRILEQSKLLNNVKAKKINQIFFTRWLSFVDSVQALAGCIGAVISALQAAAMERDVSGRAVLQGVANQMATVKFLYLTHFLADVVGILGLLSLALQKENVSYLSAKSQVDAAIVAVQSMLTNPGPYTKEVLDVLIDPPDGTGFLEYKGHEFKNKQSYREKCKKSAEEFIREVVYRLSIAFPDSGVLEDFLPLSPKELLLLSSEEAKAKIARLCDHYDEHVDKSAAMTEWHLLAHVIRQPVYQHLDMQGCLKHVLHPYDNTYPNIVKLAAIGVTLPVTSVDCERGISGYNEVKTDARSSLSVMNVQTQLQLFLESPDIELFNFSRAFEIWNSRKERRGFSTMAKNAKM